MIGHPVRGAEVKFIAEVSSNHNRDLDRCLEFISTAARIGCDAVKFQLFRVEKLFAPEARLAHPHLQEREGWELPPEYLPRLARHSRTCGIEFACTPFHLEAVDQLEPWVDFFKIASYELLWHDLASRCAATGKPLVLSTGMATVEEIDDAIAAIREAGGSDLTLLHCVSGYPVPPEQCNLAAIDTLRTRYPGCNVGWSDHSVSPGVVYRAVHGHGASMVEFHLDLEGEGEEYEIGHCWLPNAMAQVIETVRLGLNARGTGDKVPTDAELPDRPWRADPSDGLRPLLDTRRALRTEER